MAKENKATSCTCIAKSEATAKEHIEKQNANVKGFKITESGFQNKSWYPETKLYAIFESKANWQRNGQEMPRPKKDTLNIFFTFCPFCGRDLQAKK